MVYHFGKPMAQATLESDHGFSSVFNSSVPQRPALLNDARSYGGRPLGPNSYHPLPPVWMRNPGQQSSAFASKTQKSTVTKLLTSDIDFLNKPEILHSVQNDIPGVNGYSWPREAQVKVRAEKNGPLDCFYNADAFQKETLAKHVIHSPRKYASSFASEAKRFCPKREPHELGPGSYETNTSAVQVHDAKRASHAFKAIATSVSFSKTPKEPADAIDSSQYADMSKHWTAKGVPFSTRERFPQQRPKWSQF